MENLTNYIAENNLENILSKKLSFTESEIYNFVNFIGLSIIDNEYISLKDNKKIFDSKLKKRIKLEYSKFSDALIDKIIDTIYAIINNK